MGGWVKGAGAAGGSWEVGSAVDETVPHWVRQGRVWGVGDGGGDGGGAGLGA
jgi:hypothetical protein